MSSLSCGNVQLSSNLWNIYILCEIGDEVSLVNMTLQCFRKAVMPNWQLAIALYYLALTAEYRMIDIYLRKTKLASLCFNA